MILPFSDSTTMVLLMDFGFTVVAGTILPRALASTYTIQTNVIQQLPQLCRSEQSKQLFTHKQTLHTASRFL